LIYVPTTVKCTFIPAGAISKGAPPPSPTFIPRTTVPLTVVVDTLLRDVNIAFKAPEVVATAVAFTEPIVVKPALEIPMVKTPLAFVKPVPENIRGNGVMSLPLGLKTSTIPAPVILFIIVTLLRYVSPPVMELKKPVLAVTLDKVEAPVACKVPEIFIFPVSIKPPTDKFVIVPVLAVNNDKVVAPVAWRVPFIKTFPLLL
jgi:hypothetical protein